MLSGTTYLISATPPPDLGYITTTFQGTSPITVDSDVVLEFQYHVPPAPTGLTATSPTNASPALTWNPVLGIDHYVVYRDGAVIGTSATESFVDSDLDADGTYLYRVSAVSPHGFEGPRSGGREVLYDTTAPTVGQPELSLEPVPTDEAVELSASVTDSGSGVAAGEYFIDADPGVGQGIAMALSEGVLTATVAAGLAVGEHTFGVRARDAAGNWSTAMIVTVTVVDPNLADIAVTASSTPDPARLGDTYTITLTVSNNGPRAVDSATTTTGFVGVERSLLDVTPSQGGCLPGDEITCDLGPLAPGAAASVTIVVEPQATGSITATTTVTATLPDPQPDNNSTTTTTEVVNGYGCTIIGTPGDDEITGTNGDDVICALGGNDTVRAGNGNDTIYGGSGDDDLDGGNGSDIIFGGNGNGILTGGNGNDTITGGDGVDLIIAGNGDDVVDAAAGDDIVLGGNGDDTIEAGDGRDIVDGGNGVNTCSGAEQANDCTP